MMLAVERVLNVVVHGADRILDRRVSVPSTKT